MYQNVSCRAPKCIERGKPGYKVTRRSPAAGTWHRPRCAAGHRDCAAKDTAGGHRDFDAGFVTRLQQRDPATCMSLVSSLTPALEARLRFKLRDRSAIEDVRNETFYRVFCLVDRGSVREPEQFGSFVRGVCDRVAQESRRKTRPTELLQGTAMEPCDLQPHPDKVLIGQERLDVVWRAVIGSAGSRPQADFRNVWPAARSQRTGARSGDQRGAAERPSLPRAEASARAGPAAGPSPPAGASNLPPRMLVPLSH